MAWPKAAVWRFGSSCSWPTDWGKHQLSDPEISDLYVSWFWKDDVHENKTYQDNSKKSFFFRALHGILVWFTSVMFQ